MRASYYDSDLGWMIDMPTSVQVHEDDPHAPQPTGLLNAHGVPLYRKPETVPFGFQPSIHDHSTESKS